MLLDSTPATQLTDPPELTDAPRLDTVTTVYRDGRAQTLSRSESFVPDGGAEFSVLNLHPEVRYQEIRGFGGALTEASAATLARMSPARRDEVLRAYFGPDGHRYSAVRMHVDSSDFSLGTYEAVPTDDPSLESFSLARDEEYVLPLLRAAEEARGAPLSVMLSPWSPPAYMKTNGSRLQGGSLKPEYRDTWARYLAKYIAEYRSRGVAVDRMSIQNEPEATQSWDSCRFTAEEEKVFLRDFLHPALVEAGVADVGIHIWDHNKDKMFERTAAIVDEVTRGMIAGVAFHWYTGDHFDDVKLVRETYPELDLVFSEGCVEYSRFDADELRNAQMYAHEVIGDLAAGMNLFLDWNIVLDEQGGPNHVGNYCDAPVMCDTTDDTVTYRLSFSYLGHFSRFIQPGARRIASSAFSSRVEQVAVRNPDGTIVVVALNPTDDDISAVVRVGGRQAVLHLPAQSLSTGIVTGA